MTTEATASAPTPGRPFEPSLRWRARAHSIEQVEAELARIWAQPNLETVVEGQPGRHIAARTSVLNLVVIARAPEVGERCAATIQRLTGRLPSRTMIVSSADPDGPSWLDALIEAHCMMPREDAPETCAEMIYLSAGGESGRHLDAIVAPLLIHDLPVTVWWPDEPPFGSKATEGLLRVADRLIVDGSAWHGDGIDRLRDMAALTERTGIAVADFALVRQSRWREAIASIFDMPAFLPYLRSIRRIAVTFGTRDEVWLPGSTNIVKPLYHVAWLASRLDMRIKRPLAARAPKGASHDAAGHGLTATLRHGASEVSVVLRPVHSEMPAGTTLRVELVAKRRGSELRADVTAEQEAVHVRVWQDGVHALERGFNAPRRGDVDLLAEAVETSGHEPVTEQAIRMAAELVE